MNAPSEKVINAIHSGVQERPCICAKLCETCFGHGALHDAEGGANGCPDCGCDGWVATRCEGGVWDCPEAPMVVDVSVIKVELAQVRDALEKENGPSGDTSRIESLESFEEFLENLVTKLSRIDDSPALRAEVARLQCEVKSLRFAIQGALAMRPDHNVRHALEDAAKPADEQMGVQLMRREFEATQALEAERAAHEATRKVCREVAKVVEAVIFINKTKIDSDPKHIMDKAIAALRQAGGLNDKTND